MKRDRVSRTALAVARITDIIFRDRRLGGILPPRTGEWTSRLLDASLPGWKRWLLRRRLMDGFARWSDRTWMPGVLLHMALRKRYIDDQVRDALAEGAAQLVVLGAGLDSLALRIAEEHPTIHCIEVDHPATQHVKASALKKHGVDFSNLELVPVDLESASLRGGLKRSGFRPESITVLVAEGLLMYLTPTEVESVFVLFRDCVVRSRFVFTTMELRKDGAPAFGRLETLTALKLRLWGEPFQWGILPEEIPGYLDRYGLNVVESMGWKQLEGRYLQELGVDTSSLTRLEQLTVAERD